MSVFKLGPEIVSGSARLSAAAIAKRQGLAGRAWRDLNLDHAANDPSYGRYFYNHGMNATGNFTSTATGSATALFKAGPSGFGSLLELDAVSSTNGQGIQVQYAGQGVFPLAGMVIYGGTMLRFLDIATAPEFFFGYATLDTTLIASDLMSATDWTGFLSLSGGTVIFGSDDGTEDLGATTQYTMVDGATTTDGTEWVNFDFRWEVGKKFEAYVNGVAGVIDDVAITAEADGAVVPSIVLQSNGTVDPIAEVVYSAFGYKFPA